MHAHRGGFVACSRSYLLYHSLAQRYTASNRYQRQYRHSRRHRRRPHPSPHTGHR